MDRSTEGAVAAAVRAAAGALVVVADAAHRAAAADAARGGDRVLEVEPPVAPTPWAGLGAVLAACRRHVPGAAVPAALEAAATGRSVGDHLGLAADLRGLLARVGEDAPWTLVVPDAHRLDLSSAAALSHALTAPPEGVRAVLTQDGSDRGVHGLPTHVVGHTAPGVPAEPPPVDRWGAEELASAADAALVGAMLDAAAAAEAAGDHGAAARWWLEGGRPERARRAAAAAGADVRAVEVSARLAHRTTSERERHAIVARAIPLLDASDPLAAVRIRLLEASARSGRGDEVVAGELVAAATDVLASLHRDRAQRVVRELLDLVRTSMALRHGGGAADVVRSVERPFARLGAGGFDPDAVQLLAAAAMSLGWHGHLDEAQAVLDRLIGVLDARRRFVLLSGPLATSAWLARRRGRLDVALAHGVQAMEVAGACGWVNDARLATVEVAHVEALHGRLDDCRRHTAALVAPGAVPRGVAQLGVVSALAVGELLADDPVRAIELLEPVQRRFGEEATPGHTSWRHNLVEAYVLTGRRAEGDAVLRDLLRCLPDPTPAREEGQVAWCRGMLAAPGEHDEHFADAHRLLGDHPTLRWRADLHHLRRLLDEGRHAEARPLAARLRAEASGAGLHAPAEQVRRLQQHHGFEVAGAGPTTTTTLPVEDIRVALALAEGAEIEDVAAHLRTTPQRVEVARDRITDLLGASSPADLARFLQLEPADPTPSAAVVRVLGPVVVQRAEQQLVPPAGRPASVLALVAIEGSVTVERLLDVLWPDVDLLRSRPRLRNVLARLRAAVGPVVERDGDRLSLAAGVDVDAAAFDRLADLALRAPAAEVLGRTDVALAAWAGEPLVSWPYEDWALRERQRLVQRCVALRVRRADALVEQGAVGAALDELEAAVAMQPDARELWERAVGLAEADDRTGRARALRRWAADHDVGLV